MCRSVYVGGSCFWDCGSGLRIRACWLLCGDGSNLEAVLAPRRLLEFKRRQGPRAVLGFLEELCFGCWLSSHRLRNGCVVDRAVSRPSDDSIPSLPTDAGTRTALSTRGLELDQDLAATGFASSTTCCRKLWRVRNPNMAPRDPTAWLGMSDSNSETSGKIIPFERSPRFPGIQPNSSHGGPSRLSCAAGDTQLGPGSCNGGPPSRRKLWRGLR